MKSYLDLARQALQDPDTSMISFPHYDEIRHYDINTPEKEREEEPPSADLPARLLDLLRRHPGGLTDSELAAALPGVAVEDLLERALDLYERGLVQAVQEPGGEWRWQARTEALKTTKTTKTTESVPALETAVSFSVPGLDGPVWLVADDDARQRLIDQGEPQGCILTSGELALLEPFSERERVEILHWKITMNARALTAAPPPAKRYGAGEKGWAKWRIENLDAQIREHRGGGRK